MQLVGLCSGSSTLVSTWTITQTHREREKERESRLGRGGGRDIFTFSLFVYTGLETITKLSVSLGLTFYRYVFEQNNVLT